MDRDLFPEIVSTLVFIQLQPDALIGFCWLPWCAFFFFFNFLKVTYCIVAFI